MKSRFYQRLHILIWLTLLCTHTSWSQFENTIGNLAGSDETTDIKPLPNGHTIVLANTASYGAAKILLLELDALGNVIFYKTIYDVANPNVPYSGNSLAIDPDAAGNPGGYFITGCKGDYPTQMVLIRTDLNGTPTWARQMDNASDPNSPISECGISLERQTNTDVIVVGRSDQMADLKFTVSRFSAAGIMNWSYRYGSTTGLQFIPNESCNGKRNHEDVVAVVGHIHDAGIGHTFMSCIKADNGMEFWRSQYNSDHFHDDGTDVVQHPTNQRFFIEGHAEELFDNTRLWTVVVNPNNGNLINGATYSLVPPFYNLFGRDICFNPLNSTVSIVGFCDFDPFIAPVGIGTFILNLPFMAGAAPNFSHFFTHSDPQLFLLADDAIEFVEGVNPGYIIGTQAKLPGAAFLDYDVHALRVNLLGIHNLTDCPVVPFTPESNNEGISNNLKKNKSASTWSNLILGAMDQDYIEDPCGGVAPPPQSNSIETRSFNSGEFHLYPNPATAGAEVYIQFELKKPAEVEIELLDITGTVQGKWREWRNEGRQIMPVLLPSDLADQLYMIRIHLSDKSSLMLKLIIK